MITDLRGQRTFLIQKVVAAQRLALCRCHDNYVLGKRRAWMRFVKNTRMETKASLNRRTANNLAAMHDLKARMA